MLIAQGGAYGGWSLYLHEGRPAYCYNFFGLERFKVYGEHPVPAGEHQVRMEFTYDGGGLGKGGDVTLYVDGDKAGAGARRAHRAGDLLRRRDDRPRPRQRHARQRRPRLRERLHRTPARGCRSTSTRPPRTSTT